MPHPASSPSPAPEPAGPVELLTALADRLAEAHAAGVLPGAAVVRARPTADGVDLAVLPVPDGRHPADVLVGTVLPRRWAVSGVVAHGEAVAVESGGRAPVALAVVVDRAGRIAHRVLPTEVGGPPGPMGPPSGPLVDVLHRSLELPTPPPAAPSGPWWSTLWLDRVVAAVADDPTRHRTLLSLGALHPLVGPGLTPRAACVLHRIAPARSVEGWEVMRRALGGVDELPADRSPPRTLHDALRPLMAPAAARWHDQGSFARALGAALPPREVLLAAVDALLAPRLAAALRAAAGEEPT